MMLGAHKATGALRQGLQMAEASDEFGFIQHVCSNLHPPHPVHAGEKLEQLCSVRGHSRAGRLYPVSCKRSDLQAPVNMRVHY